MTRETKFRVWCKNKGEWEKHECYLSPSGIIMHMLKTGVLMPLTPENHIALFYTGLKDKNSKEIYEGDIVTWVDTEGTTYVKTVSFRAKDICFTVGNIAYTNLIDSGYFQTKLEVIGNIYQNKELLEAVKKEG